MKNNIELFDNYIDEHLTAEEKRAFEERLQNDRDFRKEFRIYLFTLDGLCREMEQENADFAIAMKNISPEGFDKIINRRKTNPFKNWNNRFRERLGWISSIAALIIVGLFSVITVMKSGENRVDDIVVAYNNSMLIARGSEEGIDYSSMDANEIRSHIPVLTEKYRESLEGEDTQEQKITGFTLAMAHLKLHQRKEAKNVLIDLTTRFADDVDFSAQCNEILSYLE